ncbi:MAG: hydroxyacylglutathione hydrolase [Betaproteobacteria bacterium]|nr:hydroxyacylglutathione hydrolase [Betaproteobacteria bacterium]
MFDVIRIPAFKDNYIWLLRGGASAIVVDPGDARPVLDVLERGALSLAAVLITHHHADHQGGIDDLLARFPAQVFGSAAESITGITTPLHGGETIRIAAPDAEFRVIPVPGHTRGHLAYYGAGCLFCGDTLFGAGCGRLFEGSAAQMSGSLARLAALPDDTAVYCAHEYTEANLRFALAVEPGNQRLQDRVRDVSAARAKGLPTIPSTLALEKATNPFLRCAEAEVIAAARGRKADVKNAAEVFAVLREWRNGF